MIIGFSIIWFSDCVKNEKTKLFFAKFGGIFIFILFLGGCANGCRIQSGFDKNRKNEKHYENMSMIATHMAIYHPNTDVDLERIRVSGWFYPVFSIEHLNEQWKQTLRGIEDWKSAFKEIKKSKLKYRFQLFENIQNAVFSKKYIQSHISKYIF